MSNATHTGITHIVNKLYGKKGINPLRIALYPCYDKNMPANSRDRILIVENDSVISDLIGRQALQSAGYQVHVAIDGTAAISKSLQWAPDLILVDLNLPGLSGKDLLVALAAQGVQTPVIIIAQRGMEADIIQAFRLGAADYLLMPMRDTEIVNSVNRVLQQVHDRRERDRLAQQLQQTNQELQSRVRELTTIFALGKAMTSVTDQAVLLENILAASVRITQAEIGWFLLRDESDKTPFVVVSQHNLPPALGVRLGYPWDDGISSLVAMSGEVLTIHGEPLRRFKISSLGLSALIVPIKVKKRVIGLLVMMRKQAVPFAVSEQHLLEALADYASISIVNARLFRAVEERARSLQTMAENTQISERVNNEVLRVVKKELANPLTVALTALDQLVKDPTTRWRPEQRQALGSVQELLQNLQQLGEAITPVQLAKNLSERSMTNLTELVSQSVRRFQPYAQRSGLSIASELPSDPLVIPVDFGLIGQAVDGVISNAIKYSAAGGQVVICLEKTTDHQAHIIVRNPGRYLDAKEAERALEDTEPAGKVSAATAVPTGPAGRFGGLGIRLSLVKEIVARQNGKVWIDSQLGKGTEFHIKLPLSK